jgi:hypothetical protein
MNQHHLIERVAPRSSSDYTFMRESHAATSVNIDAVLLHSRRRLTAHSTRILAAHASVILPGSDLSVGWLTGRYATDAVDFRR